MVFASRLFVIKREMKFVLTLFSKRIKFCCAKLLDKTVRDILNLPFTKEDRCKRKWGTKKLWIDNSNEWFSIMKEELFLCICEPLTCKRSNDTCRQRRLYFMVVFSKILSNFVLFLGYDLSSRFSYKISWIAQYIKLSGWFKMGRKIIRFWSPRIQAGCGMRSLRSLKKISW